MQCALDLSDASQEGTCDNVEANKATQGHCEGKDVVQDSVGLGIGIFIGDIDVPLDKDGGDIWRELERKK